MSHLLSQREGFLFAYDVTYTCVNHIPPHSYVPLPGVTSKVNWDAHTLPGPLWCLPIQQMNSLKPFVCSWVLSLTAVRRSAFHARCPAWASSQAILNGSVHADSSSRSQSAFSSGRQFLGVLGPKGGAAGAGQPLAQSPERHRIPRN